MTLNLMKLTGMTVVLAAAASAFAQTNPPAPTAIGPRIEFVAQEFDFGKVESGAVIKHDFIYTNTGDQVLEIKDVKTTCGCAAAGDWDKQVAPGKTGKMGMVFNTSGYGGMVHKTMVVACNDPARTNMVVAIKGTIWRAFDIAPAYAVFTLMPENQGITTQVVKIISNCQQPVTISDPASANPVFKTELKTVKEGKEFDLIVSVDPSKVNGTTSAALTVKTSTTNAPTLSITGFIMVQPLVMVSPPQIMLPQGPLANPLPNTVTVFNNSTNPLVLSEPTINVPGATVELQERQPGRQVNVVVNFPAGFQAQPGQNMAVSIKSNLAKQPSVIIPVFQPQPPPTVPPTAPQAQAVPAAGVKS